MSPEKAIFDQHIMTSGDITSIRTHSMRNSMYIINMNVITLIHSNGPHFGMHDIDSFYINMIALLINANNASRISHIGKVFSTNHSTSANSDILKFRTIKTSINKSSSGYIVGFITFQFIKLMFVYSGTKINYIRIIFGRYIHFGSISEYIQILRRSAAIIRVSVYLDEILSRLTNHERNSITIHFRSNSCP